MSMAGFSRSFSVLIVLSLIFAVVVPVSCVRRREPADITVLSGDIMTIPDEEILDTKVLYTIVGGKIMYQGDFNKE